MKSAVIGQTGKVVLSDDALQYKVSQRRTVRYQYLKVKHGFIAWVCGPFHSRTYGACSFGTTKTASKASLQRRLSNDYRYNGCLMFSDVDDADVTGLSVAEIWHRANNIERETLKNESPRPITRSDACGSAGM